MKKLLTFTNRYDHILGFFVVEVFTRVGMRRVDGETIPKRDLQRCDVIEFSRGGWRILERCDLVTVESCFS